MSDDGFFARAGAGEEPPARPSGPEAQAKPPRSPLEVGEWTDFSYLYVMGAFVVPVFGAFLSAGSPAGMALAFGGGWLFAAVAAAAIGAKKGRSPGGFLLFGLAAPYVAMVAAMLLDVDARQRAKLFASEIRSSTGTEATAPSRSSRTDELARLAELHRDGTLTDDEFSELKRQLIAGE